MEFVAGIAVEPMTVTEFHKSRQNKKHRVTLHMSKYASIDSMYANVTICTYIYIYINMYAHIHIYIYTHVNTCILKYMRTHYIYVYTGIYIYISIDICIPI